MQLSHSYQGLHLQPLRPRQAGVLVVPRPSSTTARAVKIENMDEDDKIKLLDLPDLKVKWWAEIIAKVGSAVQRFSIKSPGFTSPVGPNIVQGPLYPEFFDWEDWKRTFGHSEGYVVIRNDTGRTMDVFVHKVMPMRQLIKLGAKAAVKASGGGAEVPLELALDYAPHIDKLQRTPSVAAGKRVYGFVGYSSGGAYVTARPPGSSTHIYCEDVRVPAGKRVVITAGVGRSNLFADPVKV
jgi:hypothetical protein